MSKAYRIAPSHNWQGRFAIFHHVSNYFGWVMLWDAKPTIAAAMDWVAQRELKRFVANAGNDPAKYPPMQSVDPLDADDPRFDPDARETWARYRH